MQQPLACQLHLRTLSRTRTRTHAHAHAHAHVHAHAHATTPPLPPPTHRLPQPFHPLSVMEETLKHKISGGIAPLAVTRQGLQAWSAEPLQPAVLAALSRSSCVRTQTHFECAVRHVAYVWSESTVSETPRRLVHAVVPPPCSLSLAARAHKHTYASSLPLPPFLSPSRPPSRRALSQGAAAQRGSMQRRILLHLHDQVLVCVCVCVCVWHPYALGRRQRKRVPGSPKGLNVCVHQA